MTGFVNKLHPMPVPSFLQSVYDCAVVCFSWLLIHASSVYTIRSVILDLSHRLSNTHQAQIERMPWMIFTLDR
jgi:hypothetical protein